MTDLDAIREALDARQWEEWDGWTDPDDYDAEQRRAMIEEDREPPEEEPCD